MATTDSNTTMTSYNKEHIDWLLAEIAEVEAQMEDKTLSASKQESLLRDWRDLQTFLEDALDKEEEEDTYDPNNWVDDREDCSRCSGCAYCMDTATYYNASDEI
jgi:hypothetical protein